MGRTKWTANQQRWMVRENVNLFRSMEIPDAKYYYGMDFSITSTGVVVLDEGGNLVEKFAITTSSKDGTTLERLTMITDRVSDLFLKYPPRLFSSEAVTVSTHIGSMMDLCRVSGAVLQALHQQAGIDGYGIPYLLFPNVSSLKLAASGDPKADKGRMQMEVYAKWGVRTDTDDEADAFTAAKLGYKLQKFVQFYIDFCPEDEEGFLMDLSKNRAEFFYDAVAEELDRDEVNALVGILSGNSKGGSGMNQMQENDKGFYYQARERLKER